jgi:hypothetical protein
MTYQVFWHVPDQILGLKLEGYLTFDDFDKINQMVIDHLGAVQTDRTIMLLVDITSPGTTPRSFQRLKASQSYSMRQDLKFILVAGTDKFMRLMTLLTFNLCRPYLHFFDDVEQALSFSRRNTSAQSK